jgi:hypothetical protein
MEDNQILDKPKTYQAIGIISGTLELMQPPYSNLVVGEHTYSVTVSQKAEVKHEPGQIQNFKVYPLITKGKLGFSLLRVIKEAPERSGMTLKGCWAMYEEQPRLIIYRNKNRNSGESKTVLQLIWEEAPVADGKYWEIEEWREDYSYSGDRTIHPTPKIFWKECENETYRDQVRAATTNSGKECRKIRATAANSEKCQNFNSCDRTPRIRCNHRNRQRTDRSQRKHSDQRDPHCHQSC